METFFRNCPSCGKLQEYKTKIGLQKAIKLNSVCKSCRNSLKAGGKGIVLYNTAGERCCIDCKDYKPLSEFYNNKSGKTSICKSCSNNRSEEYHKKIYRYKKYGITKKLFDELLLKQNNTCAICKKSFNNDIHIDHDHSSNKVRGILCAKCNKGLGQFNDNIQCLTNAIIYLKNE